MKYYVKATLEHITRYSPLILRQLMRPQTLERIPERFSVMAQCESVSDYDRAPDTKLAIVYGCALEMISRILGPKKGSALDLASGPGHFTLSLNRCLGFAPVTGIDLSDEMLVCAERHALESRQNALVRFKKGDITRLISLPNVRPILSTFTGAAHHLPSLTDVQSVMRNMASITRDDGLILVMDLARLRSRSLTEKFAAVVGRWYRKEGLPYFFDDYRASLFAAWTPDEFYGAIPRDTDRTWVHLVPRGLPFVQFIFGLPKGQTRLFVDSRPNWADPFHPVPEKLRAEWRLSRAMLIVGKQNWIAPSGSLPQRSAANS